MRRKTGSTLLAVVMVLLWGLAPARAVTFTDSLTAGIDNTYWAPLTNGYFNQSTSSSGVTFTYVGPGSGSLRYTGLQLNLAQAVGMSQIAGDFTFQVSFSGLYVPNPIDLIALNSYYGSSVFPNPASGHNVFSVARGDFYLSPFQSVWSYNGSNLNVTASTVTSGTLMIRRVGGTLTSYLNGVQVSSVAGYTLPLNQVSFTVQNQNSSAATRVTFSNFSLAVPEPSALFLLVPALLIMLRRSAAWSWRPGGQRHTRSAQR
jgi:hypothetical protein